MIVKALKKLESTVAKRAFSEGNKNFKVTLFPGDGIGPEISQAVIDIFSAAQVPIEWEFHQIHNRAVTAAGDLIGPEAIDSIKRNTYALKGNGSSTTALP